MLSPNWLAHWDLNPEEAATADLKQLEAAVAERLLTMMQHQPERLAQLFYRIDVPEDAFRQALAQPTEAEQARALAQAALQRELQKAAFRRQYSQRTANDV